MTELPILLAEVTFLRPEEGGREYPLRPLVTFRYMPHLVVQSPDTRQAVLQGNVIMEDYLGVVFLEGPAEYTAGEMGLFLLGCMYPGVNYEALQKGATFTIREGPHIVGFGTVLDREEPSKEIKIYKETNLSSLTAQPPLPQTDHLA